MFSVDINGLKTVNDTLGHEAGDELICGAARCIEATLGTWGKCYRTGGDEFIVLAEMDWTETQEALARLAREADQAMYARKAEYYRQTGNDRRRYDRCAN